MNPFKYGRVVSADDFCPRPNLLKQLAGFIKAALSTAFIQGVGITGPTSIKKALNRLVQLKVVYRHEGEYKFVNPFFKTWLLWKNY